MRLTTGRIAFLSGLGIGASLVRNMESARNARRSGYAPGLHRGRSSRSLATWPDEVVTARVRAAIARAASYPHAIGLSVEEGTVTLTGPVPQQELGRVMRRVARVAGVRAIDNQLDPRTPEDADPRLSGQAQHDDPPLEREVWPRSWRLTAGAAGAAATTFGLSLLADRDFKSGLALTATGAALIARAATNRPITRLLGIDRSGRAVDLRRSILVRAPIGEVFRFWAQVENFPLFMEHVLDVGVSPTDGRLSHWQVRGPAGVAVRWDAEVTRLVPDELFAWKTLPGSQVEHAGAVHFERMGEDATLLQVRMVYVPPAGAIGKLVASVLGGDPEKQVEEDLARLKSLLEDLHTLAPPEPPQGDGPEPRA